MSPADSAKKPGGPYRKPRADVYTVLLILALIALLLGIVCLYAEMEMYEWKLKGGPRVRADRPEIIQLASAESFATSRPAAGTWLPAHCPTSDS